MGHKHSKREDKDKSQKAAPEREVKKTEKPEPKPHQESTSRSSIDIDDESKSVGSTDQKHEKKEKTIPSSKSSSSSQTTSKSTTKTKGKPQLTATNNHEIGISAPASPEAEFRFLEKLIVTQTRNELTQLAHSGGIRRTKQKKSKANKNHAIGGDVVSVIEIVLEFLFSPEQIGKSNPFARMVYKKLCNGLTEFNCQPFATMVDTEMLVAIGRSYSLLDTLILDECAVSLKGLMALIDGCPGVTKLSCCNCRLSPECLSKLHLFRKLTDVAISHTRPSNKDLAEFVKKSVNLRNVDFSCLGDAVDDTVIDAFTTYTPKLDYITIHDCSHKLTVDSFERLIKVRPGLKVHFAGNARRIIKEQSTFSSVLAGREFYSHEVFTWK